MAVNDLILLGRCAKEPVMLQGKSKAFAKWTIAVDRKYRGRSEKQVDYFEVIAFGNTARYAVRYLGKGAMHIIKANLQQRKYVDASGYTHYTLSIICESVDILQWFKDSRSLKQMLDDFDEDAPEIMNNSMWREMDSLDYDSMVTIDDEDIPNL